MSYLSVSDYLLACKEEKAREFAAYLFTALFEEFTDTYSRLEVPLGFRHFWLSRSTG
jgi:Fanconi anemia group D2 protein